jgi:uncharacterized protein (TIGR02996 family)
LWYNAAPHEATAMLAPDRALLQAILESPDDDAPRLVYADWLEEYGDEHDRDRAEFIRVQCALASQVEDVRDEELQRRDDELRQQHEERWLAPLHAALAGGAAEFDHASFERGFVHQLGLRVARAGFLAPLGEFLSKEPVRRLHLGSPHSVGPAAVLQAIIDQPALRCLRGILAFDGVGEVTPVVWQALGTAPHLAGLEELWLPQEFDRESLRAFLDSPVLERVRRVRLRAGRDQGRPCLRLLATSPRCERLVFLDLASWYIGDEGVPALANSRHLAALRELRLTHNMLGHEGIETLADSALLGRLTALDLGINSLDARAARHLAGSPHLGGLTHLALPHNDLGDEGARVLLSAPGLAGLRRLEVAYNHLTATATAHLAGCAHLSGLRKLELPGNPIGNAGALALAKSAHLGNLRELVLYSCGIGSAGARALARSAHLGRLKGLTLDAKALVAAVREELTERFGRGVMLL